MACYHRPSGSSFMQWAADVLRRWKPIASAADYPLQSMGRRRALFSLPLEAPSPVAPGQSRDEDPQHPGAGLPHNLPHLADLLHSVFTTSSTTSSTTQHVSHACVSLRAPLRGQRRAGCLRPSPQHTAPDASMRLTRTAAYSAPQRGHEKQPAPTRRPITLSNHK